MTEKLSVQVKFYSVHVIRKKRYNILYLFLFMLYMLFIVTIIFDSYLYE